MAALPSSPPLKSTAESKHSPSSEAPKVSVKHGLRSEHPRSVEIVQKSSFEKEGSVYNQVPLPGTYYLKANEARGRRMVQYAYANLTDPDDESLPFHIREKYKEIQKNRLREHQQVLSPRGTNATSEHEAVNYHLAGNKMQRPASARCERKTHNVSNDSARRSGKFVTDVAQEANHAKPNQKAALKNIQQTRSSNAVLSPKRGTRSRSKTTSPRPRRPFSIAAESTSDTDPIENQRSMEAIPQKSPPRISGSREARRQQYLATKFKLAARNSKHTQTFVAAAASLEESSGSATTVISRQHSTTQTEIIDKNISKSSPSQPECDEGNKAEEDKGKIVQNVDVEKPPIAPQNVTKSGAVSSPMTERDQESLEWKRAKVRLRSTPRSPSSPQQAEQAGVASDSRVRPASSCLASGRTVSGHSGLASRVRSPTPPATERRFTTSATQIDDNQTTDASVQVKLKKKSSPSQLQARKGRRSPSQRSVTSKLSSHSGSKVKEDSEKFKKGKKKKKKAKSRDPSLRSLRSLRSYQSDASTGILKHVKIDNFSTPSAVSRNGRSASAATLGDTASKKRKKTKVKRKRSSNKIARFLRTLSRDKEAIKVISKMAAIEKKKGGK